MHSDEVPHLEEVVPLVGEVPLGVVHLNKAPLDVVPLEDVVHPDKVLQDVVPLEAEVPLDVVPLEEVPQGMWRHWWERCPLVWCT